MDLASPPPTSLAATWWLPKPQIGNTHPGACFPFGMVSACPRSGAYPTGYGRYERSTEGVPRKIFGDLRATSFTHFHQSGTGAIRKYYNYLGVTPLCGPLEGLGTAWTLENEHAAPGYYAADLGGTGIRAELTVGPKLAVHRYTFPPLSDVKIVVDFSCGGLAIERAKTLPTRANLHLVGDGEAGGTVVLEGVPLCVHIATNWTDCRQGLWYDDRIVGGGSRLVFDHIRETTFRPFGVVFYGKAPASGMVELTLGFSLREVEQARTNVSSQGDVSFDAVRRRTQRAWEDHLSAVRVSEEDETRSRVFYTALYHSLLKPCFAPGESPFWRQSGPFVFDICTMWDIYKTQLPLLNIVYPSRAIELLNCLIQICEEEGNLPIGYRMARGADRFFRQASALAHTALADARALGLRGVDWEWALVHMYNDLARTYGEDFLEKGLVHPITHTLDLAYGCHCTALVARSLGDDVLAARLEPHASAWINAYDRETGLLKDSTYYEGTKHNYSFRLLHDMARRIDIAGGDEAFVALLDRFFGFGAEPVEQLGEPPFGTALDEGYALGRFEGLNNEPDMEVPYAYHYAGRPDRTAEVVRDILEHQFGLGRGGLPGNDDSGGLSSWYVWSSLGLFPVAGQNVFLISVPAFRHSRLLVAGGMLEIEAPGKEPRLQFVARVSLDGRELERSYLTGNEVASGGRLVIDLSDERTGWGRAGRPPSTTDYVGKER